jgi:hypothetical protein
LGKHLVQEIALGLLNTASEMGEKALWIPSLAHCQRCETQPCGPAFRLALQLPDRLWADGGRGALGQERGDLFVKETQIP